MITPSASKKITSAANGRVCSPLSGTIFKILVAGDKDVVQGQVGIGDWKAMKMETNSPLPLWQNNKILVIRMWLSANGAILLTLIKGMT